MYSLTMMKLVVQLLFFRAAVAQSTDTIKRYPFCKVCTCHQSNSNNQTTVKVVCGRYDSNANITNKAFWMNENNETYPYNSITFNNYAFGSLTYIFPKLHLTYLDLSENDISSIGNNVFMNLQNMTTLILNNNDLQDLDPDAFKGVPETGKEFPLHSLRELRLSHNKLHNLNSTLFEHTNRIEILDLSNNPLEIIDPHTTSAISSLSMLKELYLQYTQITILPDKMLFSPNHLEILDLSGNPITEIPPTMEHAKSLVKLYLNNTGFVNLTEEKGFPELPSLKELHLCRNQYLSHLKKHCFSGLNKLEVLKLSDNIELVSIDPLAFARPMNNSHGGAIWPPLKELHLGNNKLAYLDSETVARWDALTILEINDNPWTCECENQWLIDDLMPIYIRTNPKDANEIRCAAPIEMKDIKFVDIYTKKSHMRCLDQYDARPELDAAMLIGVLVGVLVTIPALLFVLIAYQRRWIHFCGLCDDSPAAYSRRFYKASLSDENF